VQGFDQIGCGVVYDEIRRCLQKMQLSDNDAYIEHLITNRNDIHKIKVTNESLRSELFNEINAAVGKLHTLVLKAAKGVEDRPHNVFIVGGGAYLIADMLKTEYATSNVVVVDDPQFALAYGISDSVFE
ncbi:stbA family protein, partial [Leclercia adecarboxylata]